MDNFKYIFLLQTYMNSQIIEKTMPLTQLFESATYIIILLLYIIILLLYIIILLLYIITLLLYIIIILLYIRLKHTKQKIRDQFFIK